MVSLRRVPVMIVIMVIIIVAIILYLKPSRQHRISSWAYQLQNADPTTIAKFSFDIVVIDYSRDGTDHGAYSKKDIEVLKSAGI